MGSMPETPKKLSCRTARHKQVVRQEFHCVGRVRRLTENVEQHECDSDVSQVFLHSRPFPRARILYHKLLSSAYMLRRHASDFPTPSIPLMLLYKQRKPM